MYPTPEEIIAGMTEQQCADTLARIRADLAIDWGDEPEPVEPDTDNGMPNEAEFH